MILSFFVMFCMMEVKASFMRLLSRWFSLSCMRQMLELESRLSIWMIWLQSFMLFGEGFSCYFEGLLSLMKDKSC